MIIKTSSLKLVLIYVYSFLFIFTPTNFTPFHILHLLFFIALVYFLNHPRVFLLFTRSKLYLFSIFIFIYLSLILLLHFFYGNPVGFYKIYVYMILFIEAPICAFFIVVVLSENSTFNESNFLSFLLHLALMQIAFVLLTMAIPSLRDIVLSTSRGADSLVSISNDYGGTRSFGLASGFTSDLGMTLGIFSMFCISIALQSKRFSIKFLLLGLLFSLGAVFNARIGLFPPLMLLFLILLLFLFHIFPSIRILCAGFIVFGCALPFFEYFDGYSFGRIFDMVDELNALLDGNQVGTFKILQSMHFFPEDFFAFWLGTGMNVFDNKNMLSASNSDIGYVNDIFQMGLLNLLVVVLMYLKLHSRTFSLIRARFGLLVLICLMLSLFIFYFKGVGFSSHSMSNYLVLVSVGLYLLNKSKVVHKA